MNDCIKCFRQINKQPGNDFFAIYLFINYAHQLKHRSVCTTTFSETILSFIKKIATIQEAVHRALYERLKNFINSWQNRNRSIITDFILSLFLVHGNNLSNLKLVWINTIEHTQVENIT